LELLKEVAPKASRVAVLYNPADRSNVLVLEQLQESAPPLGLTLQPLEVRGAGEFEDAFGAMTRPRAHVMFGAAGALTFEYTKVLVDLAAKRRIPAMWGHRQFVDAGGLMSYAVNFCDQIRRTAIYVEKILKGPIQATCPWSSRQGTSWSSNRPGIRTRPISSRSRKPRVVSKADARTLLLENGVRRDRRAVGGDTHSRCEYMGQPGTSSSAVCTVPDSASVM
jgi:ABC-type uncharacterized transport system substrate-binding protein